MDPDASELAVFVASQLRSSADEITDRWVENLSERLGVHPSFLLPTERLRDHIPDVIEAIASYVIVPIPQLRDDVAHLLGALAELRREQGYDLVELHAEFEILQDEISEFVQEVVEDFSGEAAVGEGIEIVQRIDDALMTISLQAVKAYRTREAALLDAFAERLSSYTRAISHELKNPLGAATTGARVLQDETVSEEMKRALVDRIVASLDRMDDLIKDINELAIDALAGGSPDRTALREMVHTVFEEVKEAADEKGVCLEIDGVVPSIRTSQARVRVALRNLIGNAIKYSDPDKEKRWVRVGAERAHGASEEDGVDVRWTIRVSDNGLGIPTEVQHKIFQERFRAHPEVAAGTGLGLSLTHFVVTQRGGSLDFESNSGEGTTFYLTIPARQERAEEHGGRLDP